MGDARSRHVVGPFRLSRDQRWPTVDFDGATPRSMAATATLRSTKSECRTSHTQPPDFGDPNPAPGVIARRNRPGRSIRTWKAATTGLGDRLSAAIDEARAIEQQIPDPTLGLAIADGSGENEQIHIRGSHKNLGDVVPAAVPGDSRRFRFRHERGKRPPGFGVENGRSLS